jgi:hypothetical protein
MNSHYLDKFSDWHDVQCSFAMKRPEPKHVWAMYETPDYEGYAKVFFSYDGEVVYYVEGGHCSCYGLEGQWEPEAVLWEAVQHWKIYKNEPTLQHWFRSLSDE